MGTSLVDQWLRLSASNEGDTGLIPGQRTGPTCVMVQPFKKRMPYIRKLHSVECY